MKPDFRLGGNGRCWFLVATISTAAIPTQACQPPAPPVQTAAAIKTYLRTADQYLTCLQQEDSPALPPLERKANADAYQATLHAMQQAVDDYNRRQSSATSRE